MCLSSFTAAEFGDIHSLSLRLDNRRCGIQQDSAGNSPLHLAAQHGQVAAVAYLLKRFDVNVAHGGATPLHRASFSGATATMRLLLEEPNCDLLVKDKSFGDEATPLHKACAGGRFLAVLLLLEALASRGQLDRAVSITNAAGETPMQVLRRIRKRDVEDESASVARWNSVSGHLPDWGRCEAILQRFIDISKQYIPSESILGPCLPESLRHGSVCRPGDECKVGQCRTSTWECAFQTALMQRVDVSTEAFKIVGNRAPDIVSIALPEERLQSDPMTPVFETAVNMKTSTSNATDRAKGRSCEKCGVQSIAFYRQYGMLVCKSCAAV